MAKYEKRTPEERANLERMDEAAEVFLKEWMKLPKTVRLQAHTLMKKHYMAAGYKRIAEKVVKEGV